MACRSQHVVFRKNDWARIGSFDTILMLYIVHYRVIVCSDMRKLVNNLRQGIYRMRETMPKLVFKDAFDIAMKVGDKVDVHWRQFFVVVLALVAWLTSKISVLGTWEATILSIAIILFFLFNTIGLIRSYLLMSVAISEAYTIALATQFSSDKTNAYMDQAPDELSFRYQIPIVILTHCFTCVFLLYLVWTRGGQTAVPV